MISERSRPLMLKHREGVVGVANWCREVSRPRGFAVLVVLLLIWKIHGKNGRCLREFLRS